MKERTVRREVPFKGKLIKLEVLEVTTPKGIARREVVRHPGAAAVLVIKVVNGEENVLLVKQYRKAIEQETWEIPAGKLDLKPEGKEDPLKCAVRELREETGLNVPEEKLEYLGSIYTTPGFTDEEIHIYRLRLSGDDFSEGPIESDDEIETKAWVPMREFETMIRRGDLKDAKSICALAFHKLSEWG